MPKAMILAAGFGTRLRPLTLELPKPLVWIGDRPAIAHIAEQLVRAGLDDIVVNTHHRADAFTPDVLARIPGRLHVLVESGEILGTGGGLANAAPLLGPGDVLVWNGDILAPLDVRALLDAHARATSPAASPPPAAPSASPPPAESSAFVPGAAAVSPSERVAARPSGATLALSPRPRGTGTVGVDASGRVARLRGERFGDEVAAGDFLGISVVTEALRATLPIPGCLVGDGLLPWLRAGGTVATLTLDVPWDDIGSVDAYLKANQTWLSRQSPASFLAGTPSPPPAPPSGGEKRPPPSEAARSGEAGASFIGEGASLADGVRVADSVIGAGARILGEGEIRRCVIWPNATATAPLTDTVITTTGLHAP